ncbi:MAG TPA: hypothetical protein VNB23_01365, partial [Ramlibacter sp.]|nr:hypothetical protein [Ramlibacter sp.]
IAAYKTLGGSFTGDLAVDPTHRRMARERGDEAGDGAGGERRRRIRDAVEAALSDVILLGTAEQVQLAATAATDLVAGRKVETSALVVSLRGFIREALDLEPVAPLVIPPQGPSRSVGGPARGGARGQAGEGRGGGGGARGAGGGGAEGLGGAALGAGALGRARDDVS